MNKDEPNPYPLRRKRETDEQYAARCAARGSVPPIGSAMEVTEKKIIPAKPCCGK